MVSSLPSSSADSRLSQLKRHNPDFNRPNGNHDNMLHGLILFGIWAYIR